MGSLSNPVTITPNPVVITIDLDKAEVVFPPGITDEPMWEEILE